MMKNIRKEFRFFTVPEYEKEQDYLQQRHREGWRFVRVSLPGFYTFEKCDPDDVVYQLDFNQEGAKNKDEYVQMFVDCGWEYLQDYVGYSYFRKPVSEMIGREEIFCDDESRLDMMNRIFKGKMLPLLVIFFCILVPELILTGLRDGLLSTIPITFLILLVLYLWIFITYIIQYRNCRKRMGK